MIELQLHPEPCINVPMLRHHASSGVPGWGERGSGAADTALSILAFLMPLDDGAPHTPEALRRHLGFPLDEAGDGRLQELDPAAFERLDNVSLDAAGQLPMQLWDGTFVRPEVWDLHQAFKEEVLAPLDQDQPHVLDETLLRTWVARQQGQRH